MPILGLGTWKLSNTAEAIKSALGLGYLMIDTSGDYGTQPGIGKGLRESESQREDYYIVTKVE
jgi:diketogulonate reductase-like aldo/keto reductase